MTGQELFEKSKAEDLAAGSSYPWGEWEKMTEYEQAGWDRKAAEEFPAKKADKKDDKKDGK